VLLILLSGVLAASWWWPNRPVAGDVPMPASRFNSVSFAPYRAGESPLTRTFPSRAEVDQDLTLLATRTRAIRTYAAIEGDYDLPAMARAHGLKLWQGIWLGSDRASNAREIAAGIKAANTYPDVIERVVVGNEVLLRRDLPPDELIADIDQVKRAVRQTVTYADVWNFFVDNPQVVPHLDVVTIHILPYWEDQPTNIDGAIAHVRDVVAQFQKTFPGRKIAIGETGWPSRGRWRQDAAPSLVNQVIFLRRFIALAQAQNLDYNFFQAFDQAWKYRDEGVVGASWGLNTENRTPKFPLAGKVQEDAAWPMPAALSIACVWLLFVIATTARALPPQAQMKLAVAAMLLGGALGFAWAGTAPVLFDRFVRIAAIGNLAGQAALAFLCIQHIARRLTGAAAAPSRTGQDATNAARALLHARRPAGWQGQAWHDAVFDDLSFLFVWTAAVLQLLLLYDPRYRDFPLPTFAVPVVIVILRTALSDLPRAPAGREELVAGGVLFLAAIASAIREGPLNLQSIAWNGCAVLLAMPLLLRAARQGEAGGSAGSRRQMTDDR
jgi:exo-beta-1,3-glucanase (GH17 family)